MWSSCNLPNVKMCPYIVFKKSTSPPLIDNLNGFDLEVANSEKNLGFMIANDTSWKEHVVTRLLRLIGCWVSKAMLCGVLSTVKFFCVLTRH